MWGGWGIYSPNHQKVAVGTLLQPRHPAVGFWALELWLVGPLGCPVVHRTGPVDCPVRHCACSDSGVHCSALNAVAVDHWREVAVAPLAHRTVRWIIAERPPIFPKVASSASSFLVHRTLSGGTPDSPVRHTRVPLGCLLLSLFEPFLGLFIGLLWTFGTCKTYRLEQTS
jgi:hypothetical protein